MIIAFSFSVLLALSAPPAAQAGLFGRAPDCAGLAVDLARAAAKGSRRRVAVVPFRDMNGNPSRAGAVVSERLVAQLLERGSLEVVERNQLEAVLEELRLGSAGAVDPAMVKKLGRFLGVDAIVTGTAVELLAGAVEVHARLIDVETARVLGASTARVEKDWSDFDASAIWAVAAPPVPFFPGDRRRVEWHDGLNESSVPAACTEPDARALDAKARYWAIRMRDPGFSRESLRSNPGSDIADPRARERFYSRLRMWFDEERIPPLNESERDLIARCP